MSQGNAPIGGLEQFVRDNNIIMILITVCCCNLAGLIIGIIGMTTFTDPQAKSNAKVLTIVGAVMMVIGFIIGIINFIVTMNAAGGRF